MSASPPTRQGQLSREKRCLAGPRRSGEASPVRTFGLRRVAADDVAIVAAGELRRHITYRERRGGEINGGTAEMAQAAKTMRVSEGLRDFACALAARRRHMFVMPSVLHGRGRLILAIPPHCGK